MLIYFIGKFQKNLQKPPQNLNIFLMSFVNTLLLTLLKSGRDERFVWFHKGSELKTYQKADKEV